MSRTNLDILINGERHQILIEPHWTLLHVLRNVVGMMGTKENCLEAECGVCTVLLDGKSVNSCILLAAQAAGRSVTTIEGIGNPEHLHPLQAAFIECGAVQCGYCIPGMILTAKSFLDENPGRRPSRDEIREAVAGTLCRCTGYRKIVDAVALAAERMSVEGAEPMKAHTCRVVGQRLPRLDGIGKVTGKHVYAADFTLPGMLFGKVLRSHRPHALIRKLDISRAAAIPGVRGIITAADIPAVRFGQAVRDTSVFALDRVLFAGHPIAAVAATSLEIAEQAIAAIDVEFEDLPTLFDPEAALDSNIRIHPDWETYKALPIIARSGNVSGRARIHAGDVNQAFASAYRVYEHRFTTPLVHPGYTEPRTAVADWDANSNVTVWSNTQLPFDTQNTLAEILDMPAARISGNRTGDRRRLRGKAADRRRAFRSAAGPQDGASGQGDDDLRR